jgi:hypothetical protein
MPEEATFERLGLLMGGAHPEDGVPVAAGAARAAPAPAASETDG